MIRQMQVVRVSELLQFLKSLGAARLAAMVAVALGLIGVFAIIITRVSAPYMVPLFTDLGMTDSAAIIQELEGQAIPYELRADGTVILVPKEAVLRLRMRLAETGLPSGGSVGYEIFDRGDALGATNFVQNINRLRALEGELARTISSLQKVVQARVHLVMPERQLFQREQEVPTASIALQVRGDLSPSQIEAIRHLVAAAVPGLKPGNVSIVDEAGQLLASGDAGDGVSGPMISALEEKRLAHELRLRKAVEDIVFQVVGEGRAQVQISAELARNRVTQTADIFDPESQVVRSSQSRSESSESTEPVDGGGVTVGNELPGAGGQDANGTANSARENTEEVLNYEISRTTKTEVIEAGSVNRLSVAVLVDGVYSEGEGGALEYQPRSEEQLAQIATLVRSAVGFSEPRGDTVEVVNMRFVNNPTPELGSAAPGLFDFTMADILQIAEIAALLIVGLITVLFVLRPLLKRALAEEPKDPAEQVEPQVMPGEDGPQDPRLEAAQASGAKHNDMVKTVSELVNSSPDQAADILRNWLQEAA